MYIQRTLEGKIKKYLNKKEVIAIVGARQCGKTTLIKHIFSNLKKAKLITFEDREILELFTKDIKAFIEIYTKNNKYLFIDEFQYAKEGGKQLKYIYDTTDTKIIITGSSSPDLSVQSIKYLVGRIFVFNLYPLSFKEYLKFKDSKLFGIYSRKKLSQPIIDKINTHYEEFVVYGGYPRVVLTKDSEEKEDVLKNIYNTYFLKEIKEILQIQEDFKLSKLIKVLALQVGGLTSYTELSSGTDFSYQDLLKSLNILKKTFICLESKPFFTNKKKEIIKTPKIFFLDNGFRNTIIKNFQKIADRPDEGNLHENFIASELEKDGKELKYWRTKVGAEVDFIIEEGAQIIPLEVKTNLKSSKITRSFRNFIEEYKPKKGFILSKNHSSEIMLKNTKITFTQIFNVWNLWKKT